MGGDICDTKLSLSIRGGAFSATETHRRAATKPPAWLHLCFPPSPKKEEDEDKREKTKPMELENLKIIKSSKNKEEDDEENHGVVRKKLRLTNEQSGQLEKSFCSQKTLTSIQKEELAKKVGLRPRQVEVWFQNRRARTKLKQTEVDCELLKRWCENLTDENRRLRGELNELRFYGLKVEDKRVCPSCDRLIMAEEEEEENTRPVLQLCS